jgi:hypothetical protein
MGDMGDMRDMGDMGDVGMWDHGRLRGKAEPDAKTQSSLVRRRSRA